VPAFENYAEEARRIELEIQRYGVALGVDWEDSVAVRTLAREALAYHPGDETKVSRGDTALWRSKLELFGLAQLMLRIMTESAEENIATHGGPAWKAFGRALWIESGLANYADTTGDRNIAADSAAGKGTEK
jgi:hypothetical protein